VCATPLPRASLGVDQVDEPREVSYHDWTRQSTEGFLGHRVCQGPDAWPQGEGSMQFLDPDGCLVRRPRASDTTTDEDADAGNTAHRDRDASHRPRQKNARGYLREGSVLDVEMTILDKHPEGISIDE
jgi:hypothetical protein